LTTETKNFWKKLHSDLCPLSRTVWLIISRGLSKGATLLVRWQKKSYACRGSVVKLEEKWADGSEVDLTGIQGEETVWIRLAQDRVKWLVVA